MSGASKGNDVAGALAALASLEFDDLRRRWRTLAGRSAPEHLQRGLLVRMLAYRMQAEAWGDLDARSLRVLADVARHRKDAKATGGAVPTLESLELSSRGPRALPPGTVLGREHAGVMHRVLVLDGGFSWNGQSFRSLSEVAFAITGTRWNGPRFFGLASGRGRLRSESGPRAPRRSSGTGAP